MLLCAQSKDTSLTDQLENMSVRSIGPAGMSGRVTTIDVVRNDPEYDLYRNCLGPTLEIDQWRSRLESDLRRSSILEYWGSSDSALESRSRMGRNR